MFVFVAFIEQNENFNDDNLCRIHGGLYNASVSVFVYYLVYIHNFPLRKINLSQSWSMKIP